jgi:hypothetical protein
MNTITITSKTDEQGNTEAAVIYSEGEVLRFIEKAKRVDELNDKIRDIRYKVRDFFSECEWSGGEATINKSDTNELLDSIGCDKLTTKYRGTFTVTGSFTIDVDDEDDIENILSDNISVDCYAADLDVDQVEVMDIEEDE